MRSAVVLFPGSNRDHDMVKALHDVTGSRPTVVWHQDAELPDVDLIVLPGGFSYGDYLRCGAIAARSPAMLDVAKKARAGVRVLGVCNREHLDILQLAADGAAAGLRAIDGVRGLLQLLLDREERLHVLLHVLPHHRLLRRAVEADHLREHLGAEHGHARAFLVEDDLQQDRPGEVLARLGIDDDEVDGELLETYGALLTFAEAKRGDA